MTHCLNHQLPEDQATPLGMMCPCCKLILYTTPPEGRCRAFWESQPGAYALDREPMWVFTIMWDDFRIRSLHPPDSHDDERGEKAREYERFRLEQEALSGRIDASFVPLAEDFGSIEIGAEDAAEPAGEADLSGADAEEIEEVDEHWLDLPQPESWLEFGWQPEGDEAEN